MSLVSDDGQAGDRPRHVHEGDREPEEERMT